MFNYCAGWPTDPFCRLEAHVCNVYVGAAAYRLWVRAGYSPPASHADEWCSIAAAPPSITDFVTWRWDKHYKGDSRRQLADSCAGSGFYGSRLPAQPLSLRAVLTEAHYAFRERDEGSPFRWIQHQLGCDLSGISLHRSVSSSCPRLFEGTQCAFVNIAATPHGFGLSPVAVRFCADYKAIGHVLGCLASGSFRYLSGSQHRPDAVRLS